MLRACASTPFSLVYLGFAQQANERRLPFLYLQALVIKDGGDFQHILRILGTNVDGKQKVMYAMTSVKGIGRRFSNIVCKKADVDMDKRAGLTFFSACFLNLSLPLHRILNPCQRNCPVLCSVRNHEHQEKSF